MGFLEQLRSDLQRAALDQQRTLVVQLLRTKFASLTFDDLRALLASPLGKGLGPLRVAELMTQETTTTKARAPTTVPAKKPGSSKKPKANKPKAKKSKSTAKGKSKRKNMAPPLEAAILAALEKERVPIRGPALATKLKVHRTTVRLALARLLAAGKVTTVGPPTRLSYSIKPSGSPAPASPEIASRTKPAKAKVAKTAKAKVAKTAKAKATKRPAPATPPRPPSDAIQGGQAGYDGAVLAVIRASGTGVASSTILASVGGTIDQVRAALHRLVTAGQIIRTGERKFTRYELPARA